MNAKELVEVLKEFLNEIPKELNGPISKEIGGKNFTLGALPVDNGNLILLFGESEKKDNECKEDM